MTDSADYRLRHDVMTRHRGIYILTLTIMTLFITLIRFANDTYPDSMKYLLLTDIFRGTRPITDAIAPFCYRPLLPFIAAIIPMDPVHTFAVFNATSVLLLTITIYHIAKSVGATDFVAFIVSLLSVTSYPVVAYGSAVLVDAPAMTCMALLFLGIYQRWDPKRMWAIAIVGVLFKEIMILAAVAWFIYEYLPFVLEGRRGRRVNSAMVSVGLTIGLYLLVRIIFNTLGAEGDWWWGWNNLWNLRTRPLDLLETIILPFLSWIPVGVIAIVVNREDLRMAVYDVEGDQTASDLFRAAIAPFLGFFAMGLFMAYLDMRFIWPFYLLIVPYAVRILQVKFEEEATFIRWQWKEKYL